MNTRKSVITLNQANTKGSSNMSTIRKSLLIGAVIVTFAACGTATDAALGARPIDNNNSKELVDERADNESVPSSCLSALDHAEDLFDLAGEVFGLIGEAMGAMIEFDVEGIEAVNDRMTPYQSRIEGTRARYDASAEECRGS